jgi:hypothetical protein
MNFDKPTFRLRWEWELSEQVKPPITVELMYRAITESEILEHSLFDSESILLYIRNEINERTLAECKRDHTGVYVTRSCTLNVNSHILFEREYEVERVDCVYYFCMINRDGSIFKEWAAKATSNTQVVYNVAHKKGSWLSAEENKIVLDKKDSRRIILRRKLGKNDSFSLLPNGLKEYYLDPEVDDSFEIIYLSELINV